MKQILTPVEAKPANVALDGVDIFLGFLGRIGVVIAQITVAAELFGDAEIQTNRLGVADMQVAVWLWRESRDHGLVAARGKIGAHDVADEILPRFASPLAGRLLYVCVGDRHFVFDSV